MQTPISAWNKFLWCSNSISPITEDGEDLFLKGEEAVRGKFKQAQRALKSIEFIHVV